MWSGARQRADVAGLPFSISVDDIVIPDRCPVLDIVLTPTPKGSGRMDAAPSIDRIKPSLGYVPGNVVVISWRANQIKNRWEASELRRVAEWLDYLETVPPIVDYSRSPSTATSSGSGSQS